MRPTVSGASFPQNEASVRREPELQALPTIERPVSRVEPSAIARVGTRRGPSNLELCEEKAFVLVSLDADFVDIAGVLGAPPKVIRLRCGNQPKPVIEALLRKHLDLIADFAGDNSACLEIY